MLLLLIFGLEELSFLLVHSNNYRCDGSFQGLFLSVSGPLLFKVRI